MTQKTSPTTSRRQARPATGAMSKAIDPIRILRQHVWLMVGASVVGAFIGVVVYVVALMYFPSYNGSVVFELSPDLAGADAVLSSDRRTGDIVTRLAKTETSRVMSQGVLSGALEKRDIRKTDWAQQFFEAGAFDLNEALIYLKEELSATHARDTNTFQVNWSGKNAKDVPVILQAVQESYLNALTSISDERYNSNLKTFSDQLKDLDSLIEYLETEKANFVRDNNITSMNEAANERRKRMEELTRELAEVRSKTELMTSRSQQLRAKIDGRLEPSNDEIQVAEQNPIVMNLMQRIRSYRVELSSARSRLHDGHMGVRTVERMLKAAEDEHALAVQEIVQKNLMAEYKVVSDERSSYEQLREALEDDYDETEASLRDYASALGQLNSLNRRIDNAMSDRDDLNRTIADLNQVRVRADASKVVVMQPATLPKQRAFPKVQFIVPAATFVVLGLTVGVIFLRELMDNRIKYPNDISSIAGAHLLGVIPDVVDDPTGVDSIDFVVRHEPDSVIAETFRQTGAQIFKELGSREHNSLLLISGMPEAGTTTIVVNLAASLAATGRKVAIVDANFRRPRLEEAANVDRNPRGLGDVLAGEVPVESVMISTPDSVDIVGAGSEINRVFERLNTPAMDETIQQLTRRYDIVLIDGPPGVVSGDALVLASKCDATALIVRAGSEERGLVGRLINQLRQMEATFIGVIFNRPRNTAGGYFKKNFNTMASYAPKS